MIEISRWDKVVGKLYENFIDWACTKSDATLICYQHQGRGAEEYNAKLLSIREALKPFCIKEEGDPDMKVGSTLQWPLTTSTVCRVDGSNNFHYVSYYQITEEVKTFLLSVNSLKNWGYPNNPEDLAFFKEGSCWFGSCNHERIYGIYGSDQNECRSLDRMGIEYEVYESLPDGFYSDYSTIRAIRGQFLD